MQSNQHLLPSAQPRVFHYSLDWRFLLPLSDPAKTFVLFEDDVDFSQTLEQAGIPVLNQLSFLDIERREKDRTASYVFPFGLPLRWVSREDADQIEFFRSMRQSIGDAGHLLVGFNNSRGGRSDPQTKYYFSTPHRITHQLQRAGFKVMKVFGVIPSLCIPEYIFDLNSQTINFALQHRFKRRPVLSALLQVLSRSTGLFFISEFLPCYFVLAVI